MRRAALIIVGASALACSGANDGTRPVDVPPPRETATIVIAEPAQPPETPKGDEFRCDDGKRFEIDGRSYCAYERASSWKVAERRCADNGGHLMSLDTETKSAEVKAALRSPIASGRALWFGLRRIAPARWEWVNGDRLGASSWDTGEPNNWDGNEGCAEWLVADGTWNDTRCDLEQGYLCEQVTLPSKKGPAKPFSCSGRRFSAGTSTYCAYSEAEVSWADAEKACETSGGALAVLSAPDDNRTLREVVAARFGARKMWIGFTDAGHEGSWTWTSGAKTTFTAWHPGEPNNFGGEDCAELYADTWTWNDFRCDAPLPSVCEASRASR